MDKDIENKIIKSFVNKGFQERLLYELANDKRNIFIQKMSHTSHIYLKKNCILYGSNKNPSFEEIKGKMIKFFANEKFYVISEYEDIDGQYLDLKKATEILSNNGFASFIIGLPSGFSHFKAESYSSYQPNFYLRPQIRFDGKMWDIQVSP